MSCPYPNRIAVDRVSNKLKFLGRRFADVIQPENTKSRFDVFAVPCGKCIACRLRRKSEWAARCVAEASLHEKNCFLTLTYAPEHLPPKGHLRHSDFQKFMKRLRKHVGVSVSYFMCGEYGTRGDRPHFHVLIFGYDFDDKEFWSDNNGNPLYRSDTLERLWKFGFSTIGNVTFDSAGYCASYITKRFDKVPSGTRSDGQTEFNHKPPEYARMSLRPAIGKSWVQKFFADFYADGKIQIDGRLLPVPRYFVKALKELYPLTWLTYKRDAAKRGLDNNNSQTQAGDGPINRAQRSEPILIYEHQKKEKKIA